VRKGDTDGVTKRMMCSYRGREGGGSRRERSGASTEIGGGGSYRESGGSDTQRNRETNRERKREQKNVKKIKREKEERKSARTNGREIEEAQKKGI